MEIVDMGLGVGTFILLVLDENEVVHIVVFDIVFGIICYVSNVNGEWLVYSIGLVLLMEYMGERSLLVIDHYGDLYVVFNDDDLSGLKYVCCL